MPAEPRAAIGRKPRPAATDRDLRAVAAADRTAPRDLGPGPTQPVVLLVEDDPSAARLVREWLSGAVARVHLADSLASALQIVADFEIDCVVLDLSLPDARGLEAVASIVDARPEVPVVVLSGNDDEPTALMAVQNGAQDYLLKRVVNAGLLRRSIGYAIERKRSELLLADRALRDPLTGLPNRVLFADRLRQALGHLHRWPNGIAVLFVDLDRFKYVNATIGHDAGDALLAAVAQRLETVLRPMDSAARLGGDEFLVLCEDVPSELAAFTFSERVREGVEVSFRSGTASMRVTASIGVAYSDSPDRAPDELIRDADTAMHRAKQAGGARTELFDSRMRRDVQARLEQESELRSAVAAGGFVVHYQPVVDLASGGWLGSEALVRWPRADGALRFPDEFLTVADESGTIAGIGAFVLDDVCHRVVEWSSSGAPIRTAAVNVSARELLEPTFVERFRARLEEAALDPSLVAIEVSENAILQDEARSDTTLRELDELGCLLGIDDFGTGYSALTYLRRYPFRLLKIDRLFVQGLGERREDTAIVRAMLNIASELGIVVIAEGVETEVQADRLRELGCELAQGFLFAPALAPDVLVAGRGDAG